MALNTPAGRPPTNSFLSLWWPVAPSFWTGAQETPGAYKGRGGRSRHKIPRVNSPIQVSAWLPGVAWRSPAGSLSGVRWSLLFPSDLQMFQPQAMLLLLILAVLGTPAISTGSKSTLECVPLPRVYLISLNLRDTGTLPSRCHRLNMVIGQSFLAFRVGGQVLHTSEWVFSSLGFHPHSLLWYNNWHTFLHFHPRRKKHNRNSDVCSEYQHYRVSMSRLMAPTTVPCPSSSHTFRTPPVSTWPTYQVFFSRNPIWLPVAL